MRSCLVRQEGTDDCHRSFTYGYQVSGHHAAVSTTAPTPWTHMVVTGRRWTVRTAGPHRALRLLVRSLKLGPPTASPNDDSDRDRTGPDRVHPEVLPKQTTPKSGYHGIRLSQPDRYGAELQCDDQRHWLNTFERRRSQFEPSTSCVGGSVDRIMSLTSGRSNPRRRWSLLVHRSTFYLARRRGIDASSWSSGTPRER